MSINDGGLVGITGCGTPAAFRGGASAAIVEAEALKAAEGGNASSHISSHHTASRPSFLKICQYHNLLHFNTLQWQARAN